MRRQSILAAGSMLGLLPKLLKTASVQPRHRSQHHLGLQARSGQKLKQGSLVRCLSAQPLSTQMH